MASPLTLVWFGFLTAHQHKKAISARSTIKLWLLYLKSNYFVSCINSKTYNINSKTYKISCGNKVVIIDGVLPIRRISIRRIPIRRFSIRRISIRRFSFRRISIRRFSIRRISHFSRYRLRPDGKWGHHWIEHPWFPNIVVNSRSRVVIDTFQKYITDIQYRYQLSKYRRYRYWYRTEKVSASISILRYRYFYFR